MFDCSICSDVLASFHYQPNRTDLRYPLIALIVLIKPDLKFSTANNEEGPKQVFKNLQKQQFLLYIPVYDLITLREK